MLGHGDERRLCYAAARSRWHDNLKIGGDIVLFELIDEQKQDGAYEATIQRNFLQNW